MTMRSLLLARLYAQRFLIQNDDASYKRVWKEFVQMEENLDKLIATLNEPKRLELAEQVRNDRRLYSQDKTMRLGIFLLAAQLYT